MWIHWCRVTLLCVCLYLFCVVCNNSRHFFISDLDLLRSSWKSVRVSVYLKNMELPIQLDVSITSKFRWPQIKKLWKKVSICPCGSFQLALSPVSWILSLHAALDHCGVCFYNTHSIFPPKTHATNTHVHTVNEVLFSTSKVTSYAFLSPHQSSVEISISRMSFWFFSG